jgi:surface polysaccharide O-acyltransferase-like enzyme
MYILQVTCENPDLARIIDFIKKIIDLFRIAIPVLLVIFGSLDLGKAVVAGKDDEIKAAQQLLVKRVIAGVAVFFVGTLIWLLFGLLPQGMKPENCLEPKKTSGYENNNISIVEKI